MGDFAQIIDIRQGLEAPVPRTPIRGVFAEGDALAHTIRVTLTKDGQPADLTGATVYGTFLRQGRDEGISLEGTITDNVASVTTKPECYAEVGAFVLVVKIQKDDEKRTIFEGYGDVTRTQAGTVITGDYIIMDVDTLIGKINEMETATTAANTATENAQNVADEVQRKLDNGEFVGPAGPEGPEGKQGPAGPEGPEGKQGPQGPEGPQGIPGSVSFESLTPEQIEAIRGPQGPAGPEGPEGKQGPAGPEGPEGKQGPAGADGHTPVKGEDYWTDEDKAEIVEDVLLQLPESSGINWPIGTILHMPVSPASIYGGTWEQVEGVVLVGAGTHTDARGETRTFVEEETGGEFRHKNTVDETATHGHSVNFGSYSEANPATSGSIGGYATISGGIVSNSVNQAGGDQPHNNMQPYLAVCMWKKVED